MLWRLKNSPKSYRLYLRQKIIISIETQKSYQEQIPKLSDPSFTD